VYRYIPHYIAAEFSARFRANVAKFLTRKFDSTDNQGLGGGNFDGSIVRELQNGLDGSVASSLNSIQLIPGTTWVYNRQIQHKTLRGQLKWSREQVFMHGDMLRAQCVRTEHIMWYAPCTHTGDKNLKMVMRTNTARLLVKKHTPDS